MKNVAATRGQSVSLATLLFAVGIARVGSWAGSDKELNFYSRPLKGTRSCRCVYAVISKNKASSHSQHTRPAPACKGKMHLSREFFLSNLNLVLLWGRSLPRPSMFSVIQMKPIRGQRRHMQSDCFPWVIS